MYKQSLLRVAYRLSKKHFVNEVRFFLTSSSGHNTTRMRERLSDDVFTTGYVRSTEINCGWRELDVFKLFLSIRTSSLSLSTTRTLLMRIWWWSTIGSSRS